MLYIEKTNDKTYPYKIKDGWGDAVYADKDDLKIFLKKLQEILDKK